MALRLLHQDEHISIYFDYSNDWLYADWTGDQSGESVKAGALRMLDLLRQEQCHKVLNDNRRVTSMWLDASEWGGTEWFPAMAEAGLEYFAWIYSPNVYSRLSTDLTLQHTTRPVVLPFDNPETAESWLRQM
ncbi:hypothetical protein MUN84_09280 [Hymenobacter sp. 5516J-16]|uniref:STAS/SEC14 domain-containing protein n=1 Tax=Hymenobacter sublimis TaxID=2933777 RepID=A0ABY4JA57_9BACT|nr:MULTISPECIES: hypothetical protein [Hymenobacter]UOQ78700.1 hypothetical protein MUN84_09280 [Hymenobacter sp. 5516J-16]UPL48677.1 hypothetical protein MWH26_15980 [Hymenobacter sublimis]